MTTCHLTDEAIAHTADRVRTAKVPTAIRGVPSNNLVWLSLAVVAVALPVLAHIADFTIGALFAVGIAILVATIAAAAAPVVIAFCFVFQNSVVALITPLLNDQQAFVLARSYNFVIVALLWGMVILCQMFGRLNVDARTTQILRYSNAVLAVVGIYFAVGALADPNGAIIYLRNIATPLMCLQIGLVIGAKFRPNYVPALVLLAALVMLYGFSELIFQMDFLRLFNGDSYIRLLQQDAYNSGFWVRQMQETGYVVRDISVPGTGLLFNYFKDWGLQFHRLLGPNFHPVSYAYALSFFGILLVAARRGGLAYLVLGAPVFVAAGSKGALAYLMVTVAAVLVSRRHRGPEIFYGFALLLVLYAGVAFTVALQQGNYHALGFLGGVRQFSSSPLGHGLGSSGNLITQIQDVDWTQAQHSGQTKQAVESAVAVLLYQMGVAAFVYLAFFAWLARRCWTAFRRSGSSLLSAAAVGILALVFNGILQEEALFAPLALAMMTLVAGLELGRSAPSSVLARHARTDFAGNGWPRAAIH